MADNIFTITISGLDADGLDTLVAALPAGLNFSGMKLVEAKESDGDLEVTVDATGDPDHYSVIMNVSGVIAEALGDDVLDEVAIG